MRWEDEHYRRIAGYEAQITGLYLVAIKEASRLASSISKKDKPFRFKDYPLIKKKADELINDLIRDITKVITTGVSVEWEASNQKNNEIASAVTKKKVNVQNLSALKAFRERKVNGLNLSEQIWNLKGQFKEELEMALDLGIGEGKSAAKISKDIRPYLNNPDNLFRRVRDKHGELHLSKNAQAYHPGQGVYRSSYKNALRLARTETNIAYRTADYERWQDMDFVVGIQVVRSNNPYECDVCGSLAGKYPKDFKFVGWHPNCRCRAIPILSTDEEFDASLTGQVIKSSNRIKTTPVGFNKWISNHKEDLERWKSKPYFVVDNKKYVG